jgi:hypothetical protein
MLSKYYPMKGEHEEERERERERERDDEFQFETKGWEFSFFREMKAASLAQSPPNPGASELSSTLSLVRSFWFPSFQSMGCSDRTRWEQNERQQGLNPWRPVG